jgi:hypothetical protein
MGRDMVHEQAAKIRLLINNHDLVTHIGVSFLNRSGSITYSSEDTKDLGFPVGRRLGDRFGN